MALEIDHERLKLNDRTDILFDMQTVGDQKYPLLIADNIFRDPEYVRQVALNLPPEPTNTSHPGVKTKVETDIAPLHHIIHEFVAAEFGYSPVQSVARSNFAGFAFTRIFRKRDQLTIHQCRPHADPVRIAGIIYLNTPDQCKGGTAFYRHKSTGTEECVLPRHQNDPFEKEFFAKARERGVFASYDRYKKTMFNMQYVEFIRSVLTTMPRVRDFPRDSDDDWEMTKLAEMKFNRLVCYPGFLIHSGYHNADWFGDTPETHRLTQNIFIG